LIIIFNRLFTFIIIFSLSFFSARYDVTSVETITIGVFPSVLLTNYPNNIAAPDVSGQVIVSPDGASRTVGFTKLSYVMTSETQITVKATVTRYGKVSGAVSCTCEVWSLRTEREKKKKKKKKRNEMIE
jgi:hypothetical protein